MPKKKLGSGKWIYYKCVDCPDYNKIKNSCKNPKGIFDGSGFACEYYSGELEK